MEASAGGLAAGQRALEQARWADARRAFEQVLAGGESAAARDGLGQAQWFVGDVAEAIDSKACAFELYVRAGLGNHAARTGAWISHQYYLAGRLSGARGWLARAERVLDDLDECEEHGWIAVERARQTSGLDDRAAHALRALAIARRCRAGDLETAALSVVGRAQVEAGRTEDGLQLLEEAMAGAVGGRVRNIHTLAEVYCNLILASTSTGDWARALEWCEQVDMFARAHDTAPLFGTCRGVHADVLLATGHWAEAEEALGASLATHARYIPALGGPSTASLAELRVRQGRLPEAEALLTGRGEDPAALRAQALLRLAQGRADTAVGLLERSLRHSTGSVVSTSHHLAALVDARVALGDLDGAQRAVDDLADLVAATGIRLVTARAELAAARVERARGHPGAAAERARLALTAFLDLAMPLDAAEARLELARALAAERPHVADDGAKDEARAALAVFRRLGAEQSVRAASAFLEELDGRAHGDARARAGLLTTREQQVLELVARGMSNADIAASLVITEKTASHHVSHILTKLGVHNRTEAAARVWNGG